MEVYEYFLKGFRSKLVFPSAFSKACRPGGPWARAGPRFTLPRAAAVPAPRSTRAAIEGGVGREKHCLAGPARAGLPKTGVILYRNVNTEFILEK